MGRNKMGCSGLLLASLAASLTRIASAEAGLYLAINPLAFTEGGTADGEVVKRRLEVNWYGEQPFPDDYIELTSGSGPNGPLNQTVNIFGLTDQFFVFPGNLPYPSLEQMGFTGACVFDLKAKWFHVYEDGSTEMVAEACLQSEPGWMEEHSESLQ